MSKTIINSLPKGTILHGKTYDYEILKTLGQGAFGITYLAEVKLRGELGAVNATVYVAIKEFFMHEINGRDNTSVTSGNKEGVYDKYKKKFIGEAKNLSKLKHENIIKVIEAFEENNTVYYSMEFIDGGSLDECISKKGCLTVDEALKYASEMASALSFMHSQNMLHLDLKPSNVMLRNGIAVLIDFGLSKQFDEDGNPESSTTIGGGTPGYAPIEQANYHGSAKGGLPVTMDIYALGSTIFKMLLGHTPPPASDILNDGFPINELRAKGIDSKTEKLVIHSMAPLRKDRYQNVKAFQAELIKISNGIHYEETVIDVDVVNVDNHKSTKKKENDGVIPKQPEKQASKPSNNLWLKIALTLVVCTAIFYFLSDNNELSSPEEITTFVEQLPVIENNVQNLKFENSKGLSYSYSGEINSQKMPHGKGSGIYDNGKYVGSYSNGLRHGNGTFDTSDGENHYQGAFADDLYSNGTLALSNGMYFVGTFNNGQPYNGTWYNKDKSVNCTIKNGK
ncbi:MAG: hypothetical protein E7066_07340 [Lentimicrobiaceae bacterium]|nr:hypothetical protein [Lentimicrobiaceae bacterium]